MTRRVPTLRKNNTSTEGGSPDLRSLRAGSDYAHLNCLWVPTKGFTKALLRLAGEITGPPQPETTAQGPNKVGYPSGTGRLRTDLMITIASSSL